MMGWQWRQLDHMQVIAPRSRHYLTTQFFYGPDALPAA